MNIDELTKRINELQKKVYQRMNIKKEKNLEKNI